VGTIKSDPRPHLQHPHTCHGHRGCPKTLRSLLPWARTAQVITSCGNRNSANAELGTDKAIRRAALMHQAWQPLLPSPDATVPIPTALAICPSYSPLLLLMPARGLGFSTPRKNAGSRRGNAGWPASPAPHASLVTKLCPVAVAAGAQSAADRDPARAGFLALGYPHRQHSV
jgi:hypothetical protein